MNLLRRIVFVIMAIGAITVIISGVILLNFTAPNPTGRRYSSETPITTGGGNSQAIGLSGERILAKDLRAERNDLPTELKCFCSTTARNSQPPLNECRVCMAYAMIEATYRRPDFITNTFIAESKNVQQMLYTQADRVAQISDYVLSARTLNLPLYLYTRVDTRLDEEFVQLVESTGGAVVPYFTVPGWVDPVDAGARTALAIGGGLILGGAAFLALFGTGNKEKAKKVPITPRDPINKAIDRIEDTQEFGKKTTEQTRDKLD